MMDVRLILSRIRPDAAWGWKGGLADDLTQVVWRDSVQIEPTSAEYAAEQIIIDAENVQKDGIRQGVKDRANAVAGTVSDVLTLPEIRAIIEALAFSLGGIDNDGKVRPIAEWTITLDD